MYAEGESARRAFQNEIGLPLDRLYCRHPYNGRPISSFGRLHCLAVFTLLHHQRGRAEPGTRRHGDQHRDDFVDRYLE